MASASTAMLAALVLKGWVRHGAGERARWAAQADAKPPLDVEVLRAMQGVWLKDARRSEPMDPFFALFSVPRLLRRAAVLIRGMRVELDDSHLRVTQLCTLPLLSVTEAFPLDGSDAPQRRRDMRRGRQAGALEAAHGGTARLRLAWGAPLAGCAVDELRLAGPDELHVTCRAKLEAGSEASFTAVYRRKA